MRILVLAAALFLHAFTPTTVSAQLLPGPERGPEVRTLSVVGAGEIAPAVVRGSLVTRETRCRSVLLLLACWIGAEGAIDRSYLDDAELRLDEQRLAALHAAWGYPATEVDAEVTRLPRGGVEVRFLVRPGEPLVVRSVAVHGLEGLGAGGDIPPLPLAAGARFSLSALEASQRVIAGRLAAAGYAFAQVGLASPLPDTGGPVDLVLQVAPGQVAEFGRIGIETERPVQVWDVRGFVAYATGEPFSPARMERTIERLYRVPAIERVHIQPTPSPGERNVVDTEIFVTAAEPRGLQLEGALSSYACVEGVVGWTNRYFLNRPRVLSVSAGASNLLAEQLRRFPCTGVGEDEFAHPDYFLRGDYSQALGPDTWLHVGGGFSRESAARAYVQRGVIARVSVAHELRRGIDLTSAFSPERRDNPGAAPLLCALHGVCGGDPLAALTGTNRILPLEVVLAFGPPRARRIDPGLPLAAEWTYPPLPGWIFLGRFTASGAAAATGSDFDYARLGVDASFTRYPGRVFQLAGRVRAGRLLGDGPLPPHLRLFGGGPFGVRGVEPNLLGPLALTVPRARVTELGCMPVPGGCEGVQVDPAIVRARPLGGESLVEASLEGRVWLASYFQLAAFADFGLVSPGTVELSEEISRATESLITPGIGALALTPVGPVRIDVAYDPSPARRYPLLTRDLQGVDVVPLGEVVYDPHGHDHPGLWSGFRRRLQLQLSMQQPF